MSSAVKSVFLATTKEAKQTFMPYFRKMVKLFPDILIYNHGPVCAEIKDRNVAITCDYQKDKDLAVGFGCGVVELTKDMEVDEGIKLIVQTAMRGY